MKKWIIRLLVACLLMSGCSKKVDYSTAIDHLKQQYDNSSINTQVISGFVDEAIQKAKQYCDIEKVGFMVKDSFDSIQTYAKEHADTIKYYSLGIGAIVIVGGTVVLVVKTASIMAVLALIANKIKNNDQIQLAVQSFDSMMNGKDENEEVDDLKDALEDGYVITLDHFTN